MFELNIFSVFTATFLAIAVGIVWYSPWLFGTVWMRLVGLGDADREAGSQAQRVFFGAISQFVFFFVLGKILMVAKADQYSMRVILILLGGMILALVSSFVVWERKPLSYFLITSGYLLTILVGGTYVLYFWPW